MSEPGIEIMPGDWVPCPAHTYSERSARDRLTRSIRRGGEDIRIWACGDHWHAESAAEYPPYMTGHGCQHLWGMSGRPLGPPLGDDRCLRCGRMYADLPLGAHTVDPDLDPG